MRWKLLLLAALLSTLNLSAPQPLSPEGDGGSEAEGLAAEGLEAEDPWVEGLEPECSVLVFPGSDPGKVWIMDEGIWGHWSQGSALNVFESHTVTLAVAASGCPAAAEGRGCAMKFDPGNGQTMSIDLPFVSAEGIEIPISHLSDGVYNSSIYLSAPYNYRGHFLFAKQRPIDKAVLEVMFPPAEGYEFGRDMEPFLQLYVQDESHSLLVAGTTATAAKRMEVYLHLDIQPDSEAVAAGATKREQVEWSPNSRKIFLGRNVREIGGYTIKVRMLDVLQRPLAEPTIISFRLSAGATGLACTPGDDGCQPQRIHRTAKARYSQQDLAEEVISKCGMIETQCGDCNGRGECIEGACHCYPDFAGPQCQTHILSDGEYLPELFPTVHPAHCHQSVFLQRGSEDLMRRVSELQFHSDCQHLSQRRFNKTQGLGVTFRWLGLSLMDSVRMNRTLVIGGRWRAFNFEGCEERGLWCYLAPLTNCQVRNWTWADIEANDFQMPEVLEIPVQSMNQGMLWWSAQVMGLLMQPSFDIKARIREIKATIGWEHPIIGLHVRHGDSCADMARKPCIGWEVYLESANRMATKYDIKTIFLATDDQDVVRQAKLQQGIRYITLPQSKEIFANHMYIEHRMNFGVVDRKGVSDATFLDLFLLRDCDALIGTFGSHFSKVAYEMSVSEKGFFPPYISLDGPWQPLRRIVPSNQCVNPYCFEEE